MDGKAPTKPGEQKVTNQRAGWKTPVLLMLCLLQAANALKGPRLVSGELGGSVTIQCRYAPLLINSHQRKYWCRLSPRPWLCHTVVSTNHYTQRRYRGRVSLTDFPQKGFFVVRLSQLSPEDVGRYRCGIGNSNDMLFFSMNLTVSAGLSRTIPTATLAAGEPNMGSSGTASPAANRWTPGTIQTIERQGTGWDSVALTLDTSKTTALAKGRQTPEATATIAPGTGGQVGGPIWATVPTPLSPASTIKSVSTSTEAAQVWGTRSSDANRTRASRRERATTTGADGQRGETQRVSTALHTAGKVIGTIRPSNWVLEKWMWTTLHDETLVSKPQALGSIEGTTPAAVVWTSGPTSTEMASAEGSGAGDLDNPAGDGGPQATPSQALAAGPLRPPGKDPSMKSVSLEGTSISRVLAPPSTMLFLLTLAALVLLQRKLQRKRNSQEIKKSSKIALIQMTQSPELSIQPDLLAQVGRKLLQDDPPHLHAA